MNNLKIVNRGVLFYMILTGMFLVVGNRGMSQQDSLWHGEISIAHSTQSDLRPSNTFSLNNYTYKTSNQKVTLLGTLTQFMGKEKVGLNYGFSYYNVRPKGYSLIKFSYSDSIWFPKWTGEAKYWYSLSKPLSLGLGLRHTAFAGGEKMNMVSADLTYYLKNWMIYYYYASQLESTGFHIYRVRKYGKRASSYLEFGGGSSALLAKGINWQVNQVHSRFVQLGIQQSISDKLKVKCTLFYNQYQSSEQQKSFIDYQISISRKL